MQKTISSICVYCGCSCKLNFVIDNGKIVKVLPDAKDEVSEGKPISLDVSIGYSGLFEIHSLHARFL